MSHHALASSATAEHYTPREIIRLVHRVMGGIDLDPASCPEANSVVGARMFYTAEQNGLEQGWYGRLFINPPGDRRGSLPKLFWIKLGASVNTRDVTEFTWLAFNISQLRTLQDACPWLLAECDVCIPSSRIRFSGDSPTKDNAVLYWGPNRNLFRRNFSDLGQVWFGRREVTY